MWFFVVLLLLLAAGCLVVARWPRAQGARQRRGNVVRLEVQDVCRSPADMVRFDTTLDRRSAARWLSAAASFAVAALAVALVAGVRRQGFDLFGPSLYLGIISTAWIAGLLGEVAPRVRAQSPARAARLRSPGVSDFLHPALRGYLALLALIGVLALVPGARPPLLAELPTVSGLFPAIVFLGCELFARLVVMLPQPAVDPGELYLADTLRADALWNAYHWGTIFTAVLLVVPFTTEMQDSTAGDILSLLLLMAAGPFPRSSTSDLAGPTFASASAYGPSFRAPPWSRPLQEHRRVITIDTSAPEAPYEQVREQVRAQVDAGELRTRHQAADRARAWPATSASRPTPSPAPTASSRHSAVIETRGRARAAWSPAAGSTVPPARPRMRTPSGSGHWDSTRQRACGCSAGRSPEALSVSPCAW